MRVWFHGCPQCGSRMNISIDTTTKTAAHPACGWSGPFMALCREDEPEPDRSERSNKSRCKGCDAVIYWGRKDDGKAHPYDDEDLTESHFKTCPERRRFTGRRT